MSCGDTMLPMLTGFRVPNASCLSKGQRSPHFHLTIALLFAFAAFTSAAPMDGRGATPSQSSDQPSVRLVVRNLSGVDVHAIVRETISNSRDDASLFRDLLQALGYRVAAPVEKQYDATLQVELSNQDLGARYSAKGSRKSVTLYTGAKIAGKLTLTDGKGKILESTVFEDLFEPPRELEDWSTILEKYKVHNSHDLWVKVEFGAASRRSVYNRELLYLLLVRRHRLDDLNRMLQSCVRWIDCRTLAAVFDKAGTVPEVPELRARYYYGSKDWERLYQLGDAAIPALIMGLDSARMDVEDAAIKGLTRFAGEKVAKQLGSDSKQWASWWAQRRQAGRKQ